MRSFFFAVNELLKHVRVFICNLKLRVIKQRSRKKKVTVWTIKGKGLHKKTFEKNVQLAYLDDNYTCNVFCILCIKLIVQLVRDMHIVLTI